MGTKEVKTYLDELRDYQSSPFASLKHPFELCIGDSPHMDSPFNGHCDGIVVAVRMMMSLPSDEPVTPHRYDKII